MWVLFAWSVHLCHGQCGWTIPLQNYPFLPYLLCDLWRDNYLLTYSASCFANAQLHVFVLCQSWIAIYAIMPYQDITRHQSSYGNHCLSRLQILQAASASHLFGLLGCARISSGLQNSRPGWEAWLPQWEEAGRWCCWWTLCLVWWRCPCCSGCFSAQEGTACALCCLLYNFVL